MKKVHRVDQPYTTPYWVDEITKHHQFYQCTIYSPFDAVRENSGMPEDLPLKMNRKQERTTYGVCQQNVFDIGKYNRSFLVGQKGQHAGIKNL